MGQIDQVNYEGDTTVMLYRLMKCRWVSSFIEMNRPPSWPLGAEERFTEA